MRYKSIFSFSIFFVFSLLSCNSQEIKKDVSPNLGDANFSLDVQLFPNDNNIAKSAVVVNDGFIIAGQKFVHSGSIVTPSAIVKLSKDGDVLKEQFVGNNLSLKRERLESIFKMDEERVLLIGEKVNRMWLRLMDNDLNILKDTVFSSIDFTHLRAPKAFFQDEKIIIISNSNNNKENALSISFIDNDLNKIEHFGYNKSDDKFNYLIYTFFDAAFDAKNKLCYILGSGCLEFGDNSCNKNETSIIVYDTNAKKIKDILPIEESSVKALELHENSLYIAGTSHMEMEPTIIAGQEYSKNIYFVVSKYSLNGEKLSDFTFDEYRNENLYDMKILNDKIHVVGEMFNDEEIRFYSAYLQFDLSGNVLEKRIFSAGKSRENRIITLYGLPNDKILLLGKGDGWRMIIK